MFTYQDIAFRVIERDDLDTLRKLHNDQSTYLNLFSLDFVDEEDQLEWWKNLHHKHNDKRYVLCFASQPAKVFGRLRIQNINALHNNCEIGLDILPEYRKQGLGQKSYQMLLEFLFLHYNMNMVYVKVADFNPEAKRVYEKSGFTETGRFPQYFYRYGKYWDYIIMSVLKSDYLAENR